VTDLALSTEGVVGAVQFPGLNSLQFTNTPNTGTVFFTLEDFAKRKRPALALVKNETCEGCRVGIPPQKYLEILKGEALTTCENCGRILLHPDMVPASAGAAAS